MDFAQATLLHESIGITPFELELGFPARMCYDWQEHSRVSTAPLIKRKNREKAQKYAYRAYEAWKLAKKCLQRAQEKQKKQADKRRREPDFDVGDFVYISRKGWQTERPSTKLDYQAAGPFKILEKVGHSFRLELPPHIKIYDVVHADRLRKAPMNPLEGQEEEPQPSIEVEGQQEWEVTRILASRIWRGKLQYRAQWKGYDEDESFYNAEGFKGCPHRIRQFHEDNPIAAGPPIRLAKWLKAWEEGELIESSEEDNVAERKNTRKTRRHARG